MHWNGYAGCVMGVGGALGCDGAVRLHGAHRSLILCMAGVIPGQKIEHSARDSMDVHPPCAACNSSLKSQVVLLQTAHSWANAGVLLGARMHRERGSFRSN